MSLRRQWKTLLPWAVVIAYAAELYIHWSQMGGRLVTHFTASGVPNAWQSKDGFALTSILTIAAVLAVCLVVINAYGVGPQQRRPLFALYYGVAVFLGFIFWGLVEHNLRGGSVGTVVAFITAFTAGALGFWIGGAGAGSGENIPRF